MKKLLPKDFTQQEQFVAQCLDELQLRYTQQVEFDKYIVDFLIENSIILEADGFFGHFRKADKLRDDALRQCNGVSGIIHIKSLRKEKIKKEIMDALCLVE